MLLSAQSHQQTRTTPDLQRSEIHTWQEAVEGSQHLGHWRPLQLLSPSFQSNPTSFCSQIEFLERIESGIYRVGSGFRFNQLGVQCSTEGFTGLEFAGGIPGTVGGATFMNAGANGQETADAIDSIDIVTVDGRLQKLNRRDLDFGYRSSPFQDMEDLAAIVAVTFQLKQSKLARKRQQEYLERRRMTQPVRERSAGSVFRNPSNLGVSAAELIEKAGLKGFRVGGAMISNMHANFFINSGGSTSQDMLELIRLVKEKVNQKFGVQLMEEVLYVDPYCNS